MTKTKAAEPDANVATAEAEVAALTRDVHVTLVEEQRLIQERLEAARARNDNAAFVQATEALDAAKRKRNAVIDKLEYAKGLLVVAKQEADDRRRRQRRAETLQRAEAVTTASSAELLEEQRQLPARLAAASKDVDIERLRDLRRRQADLPDLIYAAQMVEWARTSEAHQRRAEAEKAKAAALGAEWEAVEEQRAAADSAHDRSAAQAQRDRIAGELRLARAEARESLRRACDAERQMGRLATQELKREAPVVRSLIGWDPGAV